MTRSATRAAWLAPLLFALAALVGCPTEAQDDDDIGDDDTADPSRAAAALIVDHELRHVSAWVDVLDGLEAAGVEACFRRFYPHVTDADVDLDGGIWPHELVVVAAGRSPGNPSSRARLAEVEPLERFVREGGTLVLVTQSGWEDSHTGASDWVVFNRLLEQLELPIRVDRNGVIGAIWQGDPAPPHLASEHGYPTPLEFELGYPYFQTSEGGRVAGGSAPTLRVASDEVQVLLRTYADGYLWNRTDNALFLTQERAVAAMAEAGEGRVVVVPRGTLLLSSETGTLSDKPAMDGEQQQAVGDWTADLMAHLVALSRGEADFQVTQIHDSDALFSVEASNLEPWDPAGDVVSTGAAVYDAPLPAAPPGGALAQPLPEPGAGVTPPAWFSTGGGRLGYGSLTPDDSQMADAFGEAAAMGVDALMTSTDPSQLATLAGDDLAAEQQRYADIAAMAEAEGARWFVGDWFNANAGDYPNMVGAHGGATGVPAPLHQAYWDDVVIPMYAAVGEVAGGSPGLTGVHLDLELYSGPIQHHDGWAFSDDTAARWTAVASDAALADDVLAATAGDRLELLVDAGALGEYLAALEAAAEALGQQCREAAHAGDPDLELMVYLAGAPNTWWYHGLLRGLGTPERPVIVLSYEGWSDRTNQVLVDDGISMVHLGGTIVGHYQPIDFDDVLVALAHGNDGYWYFTFNDFSSTNPDPPEMHGSSVQYRTAVITANLELDGLTKDR